MIKDNIKNIENYCNLPERVKKGLEYIKDTDFSKLQNGKHEILGNKVFAVVQDYLSKPLNEGKFEAHKKYTDIQYIIQGEEKIGVGDINNFTEITEYNTENDIVFLVHNSREALDFISIKEQEFAIFTPEDAHMPSIAVKTPNSVRKAVVKVLV